MKPGVNDEMLNLVLSKKDFAFCALYDVKLQSGVHDYFTDLDISIDYGGVTWKGNSLRFMGLRFKIGVGWQVDEQDLRIAAFPDDQLCGANFFQGIQEGLLDGAYITRWRAYWDTSAVNNLGIFTRPPLCVIPIFIGRVSTITKIGRTHAEMKVKSPLSLLDIEMPRNYYGAACQWTLYGPGCLVDRPTFSRTFVVDSVTPQSITPVSMGSPVSGGDGSPFFRQGRIIFTSGVLDGLQVTVASNDGVAFFLQYPLENSPDPGDNFIGSAGCDKTFSACDLKFNNKQHFRGFPRVPPVYISA